MTTKTIDHGDVVEHRLTVLTSPNDPDMIVLRPDLVPDAVEKENVYFLRRHKDGQLCDGHLHESLDEARSCTDRTKLDGLWQGLARIMADIPAADQRRICGVQEERWHSRRRRVVETTATRNANNLRNGAVPKLQPGWLLKLTANLQIASQACLR